MSEREQFEAAFLANPSGGGLSEFCWRIWQAARAQPAQAGQVLTHRDVLEEWTNTTLEPCTHQEAFVRGARWAEQAVLAKGVPMERGWMCLTDFQHELGAAAGGVTIYPSLEDLKANRSCWEQCGVIEVGIVGEKGGA